jgi:hypothetical protein
VLYKNNSVVKIMEDMSHVEKSLVVAAGLTPEETLGTPSSMATRSMVMGHNSSWLELMGKMFS